MQKRLFDEGPRMRIEGITVDNFKSLSTFSLSLEKFTCLIGLNGSGKSTVLQVLDFLAQQVRGDLKGWLKERSWNKVDLKSTWSKKFNVIMFAVSFDDTGGQQGEWVGTFNLNELRCTREKLSIGNATLDVGEGKYSITDSSNVHGDSSRDQRLPIPFEYEGSILSQLKESQLPAPILDFKRFLSNLRSLDLLSPHLLRQRTRESGGVLGLGGQRLSAFLHELGRVKIREITERLRRVYPSLAQIDTKSLKSGWKSIDVYEKFKDLVITTEARHVNDGLLRLMAILAELESDHQFLLFDEIENGVNPELVEFVMDQLVNATQQVVVTTHSPMILNYLEDHIARRGVIYLYKDSRGQTRSIPFFEIPSLAKKFKVMGPGEAFADTDLTRLQEEIEQMPGKQ